MTAIDASIERATASDLDGILALQAANLTEQGGMLSAEFSRTHIEVMMYSMPLIVARRGDRIIGFLMAATRSMNAGLPVVRAMLAAYPGSAKAYIYGPICVARSERGNGLAAAMFLELRRLEPGREGLLFIRIDNESSLRAHRHMGMREVCKFEYEGTDFAVFSYIG